MSNSMPSHRNAEPIGEKERRSILERANAAYLSRGFRVVSRTNDTVQLAKPKRFNLFVALLGMLICVAGWPNYHLVEFAAQNKEEVTVSVDQFGNVTRG